MVLFYYQYMFFPLGIYHFHTYVVDRADEFSYMKKLHSQNEPFDNGIG